MVWNIDLLMCLYKAVRNVATDDVEIAMQYVLNMEKLLSLISC